MGSSASPAESGRGGSVHFVGSFLQPVVAAKGGGNR